MVQLIAQTDLIVVLQIGAHAGPVKYRGNAVLCQMGRRANARAHQNLGRPEGTCSQYDFTACCRAALDTALTPHHAARTTVVYQNPVGQCTGRNRQIRAVRDGFKKPVGCTPALPLVLVDMNRANTVVVTAVEVID